MFQNLMFKISLEKSLSTAQLFTSKLMENLKSYTMKCLKALKFFLISKQVVPLLLCEFVIVNVSLVQHFFLQALYSIPFGSTLSVQPCPSILLGGSGWLQLVGISSLGWFSFLKVTIGFKRVPSARHISTTVKRDCSWPVVFPNTVFAYGISNYTGVSFMFPM